MKERQVSTMKLTGKRHLIDEKSERDFFKKETIVQKTKCLPVTQVQRPTEFTNTIGDINEKNSSPR